MNKQPTLRIPKTVFDQFKFNPNGDQRWGQALHEFLKLEKCEQDKVWCDRLYTAPREIAERMVQVVLDHSN